MRTTVAFLRPASSTSSHRALALAAEINHPLLGVLFADLAVATPVNPVGGMLSTSIVRAEKIHWCRHCLPGISRRLLSERKKREGVHNEKGPYILAIFTFEFLMLFLTLHRALLLVCFWKNS